MISNMMSSRGCHEDKEGNVKWAFQNYTASVVLDLVDMVEAVGLSRKPVA